MAPFQNFVRWSRLPTKMTAKLKICNRWTRLDQTWQEWSSSISKKARSFRGWKTGLFRFCIQLNFKERLKKKSIFSNSSHLELRAGLSDTNLKGTHLGTIPARFGLIWFSGYIFLAWRSSWLEVGITGQNFGRGPSKDHSSDSPALNSRWLLLLKIDFFFQLSIAALV
jgi:hypothetical protein